MLLKSVQNTTEQFCLLQLDEVQAFAEHLGIDISDEIGQVFIARVYEQMTAVLSEGASGVIISPEYNFSSILKKDQNSGLILGLEQRLSAIDPLNLPPLIQNWGVEHIRNNYALAKLELFYHPSEPEVLKKQQLVSEIYEYCQMLDIDFLLELKIFPAQESLNSREAMQEAQIIAIEDFRNFCSLIALEYPGDTLTTLTLTAELDIPWILTNSTFKFLEKNEQKSESNTYDNFKENLRIALESGARGYMAGNLIWQDIFGKIATEQVETQKEWQENFTKQLATKVRDRVLELTRIASEAGKKPLALETQTSETQASETQPASQPQKQPEKK